MRKLTWIAAAGAVLFLGFPLIAVGGCEGKTAEPAGGEKAAVSAEFVNTHCPIVSSKIDPDKVTPELTREFQGKKVAFCCAGCPAQWDKLSEEEKAAKLAHAGHSH
jgi:hypothetical protein